MTTKSCGRLLLRAHACVLTGSPLYKNLGLLASAAEPGGFCRRQAAFHEKPALRLFNNQRHNFLKSQSFMGKLAAGLGCRCLTARPGGMRKGMVSDTWRIF